MKSVEEAKHDLLIIIKYIRFAIEESKKNGTPRLGILCIYENGSGKIECKFDCEFIEDVALLIGSPKMSETDRNECRDVGLDDVLLGDTGINRPPRDFMIKPERKSL